MTSTELLWSTWRLDPFAVGACVCAGAGYALAARAGRHPRGVYLAAAALLLVAAVASPVGTLAEGYLFSAHMLQHLLLVLAVPPLVLLGLPPAESKGELTKRRLPPLAGWALGVSAMWLWHEPTLCDAASQSAVVHRIQEASLLVMGTAFWWPILSPHGRGRLAPLSGIAYLFSACIACTALGILVTFSPRPVCSVFLHPDDRLGVLPLLRGGWGLTPDRDQQIGGLLMWVPACLVYGAGILGLVARFYREEEGLAREGSS